ncbi:MAG: OmpH family outer membrane protein [Pseudomonadota bacterium]|jgi:Skp family chaperone for outer membrane proteins|nr:OmpH family outer membrane protein [Alphaproteobacteria bacterium]
MMFKRQYQYLFHILITIVAIAVAYFVLKPHYKTTGLTVGLVNMDRVRAQAEPFQLLHKRDFEARAKAQEHLEILEKSMRKEYDDLQILQQKKHTKAEELAKRKAELDKKVAELDQHFHQERESIKQKFDRAFLAIETELENIIREYSKNHSIDLFLNTTMNEQQVALVADESLNHTDAIIKLLNKKIPNLEILNK